MESIHRFFLLDALLQSHRHPVSKGTLLLQLQCSASTLKRLIQTLKEQYNYPIRYSRQKKGYYYEKEESYPAPRLWFHTEELQVLLLIHQLLEKVQPGLLSEYFLRLTKNVQQLLAAAGQKPTLLAKKITILPIAHQYIPPSLFTSLSQATLSNAILTMEYQDIHGRYTRREISPQRLVYYRNNWYVDAWCHLRKALRTFFVGGIRHLAPARKKGKNVSEEVLSAYLEGSYGIFSGPPLEVAQIHFTGTAAMRIRGLEWHPKQEIQANEDGSVELWVPYSDHRELILDILRYGAEAKVLAPSSLQREVVTQLQKALAHY